MTDILIIPTEFTAAAGLTDLLSRRRAQVECATDGKALTFVCSAAAEAALGGQRGVVEKAKVAGAKRVIIVDEAATELTITEELGGRMVRFGLPAGSADALRNGPLLMLSDLIAAPFGGMVAADAQTGALIDMTARVARTDVTVFINGPTGSGKEVLARTVHDHSRRADAPFVAINCAAIPENMLEAILFGYEKGSFTGASTANKGIVRAADGGTLLLDEISEMPLGLQAKLLRVLQEKKVTPLGSQNECAVDIRVIATSNRDMAEAVAEGTFREDLYYRLNVFPLATQKLAERAEDIPALAAALLRRHCGEALPVLTEEACDVLMAHTWPGNVRELENVIQRALVLHDGKQITAEDIMLNGKPGLLPHTSMAQAA